MKFKRGTVLMTAGVLLILGAAGLLFYNRNEDTMVERRSASILSELKTQVESRKAEYEANLYVPHASYAADSGDASEGEGLLSEEILLPQPDIFEEYEEEPVYWVDTTSYLGVLYIPALGIELPVISDWSYSNLRMAPCRYNGSVEEGNLVIAAHNYGCHFGHISTLNTGDEIIFTDGDGIQHRYSVVNSELIGGRNVTAMEEGSDDWDITLFTCNYSGTNRVTVRGALIE